MKNNKEKCLVCESPEYSIRYTGNIKAGEKIPPDSAMFVRKKILRPDIAECKNCGFAWSFYDYDKSLLKEMYESMVFDENFFVQYEYERVVNAGNIYKHTIQKSFQNNFHGSVFDIGAFTGHLLNIMKKDGWRVSGLEPCKAAVDYAERKFGIHLKNLFMSDNILEIQNETDCKYDLLTGFDVIEHLINPEIIFKIGDSLLNENGVLILSMPDYSSFQRKLSGKNFNLFLIEHLWYFSPESIRLFSKKYGYKIVSIVPLVSRHTLKTIISRLSQYSFLRRLEFFNFKLFEKIILKIKRGDMITIIKKNSGN